MTPTAAVAVVCAVLGLAVGSFLNVVIWRVPRKESVVRPPSHCPSCDAPVAPRDNVPVLSWVLLRGRCRHCAARISPRYPLVELATAGLFAATAWRFGHGWALPGFLWLTAGLVALAVIDLDLKLLPIRVVYPTWAGTVPFLVAAALVDGELERLTWAVVGGAAAFGAYFLLHVVSPRGMAFGDVRLAPLIGFALGWIGPAHVAVGNFLAFASSAVVGLALMAVRRAGLKTAIPFGPFMVLGAFVAIYRGHDVVRAWLPQ